MQGKDLYYKRWPDYLSLSGHKLEVLFITAETIEAKSVLKSEYLRDSLSVRGLAAATPTVRSDKNNNNPK